MKFKDLFNKDWSVNWEKIVAIPQFAKLKTTKQSSIWHQEGDCYKHTQLVAQEMEKLLGRNLIIKGSDIWVMCMAAAICHDLGKADTTKWSKEKNDWTTKNHGVVGERLTRNLFCDEDIILREKVCYMVRHHMTLHHVYDKPEETNKRLIKLSHGIVQMRYMILLGNYIPVVPEKINKPKVLHPPPKNAHNSFGCLNFLFYICKRNKNI